MKTCNRLVILILLAFLPGCGTFCARGPLDIKVSDYYQGVLFDACAIEMILYEGISFRVLTIPLWTIDMIPSAIVDTVLLPTDYAKVRKYEKSSQSIDPTVITPSESGKAQGTAAEL